jgi:hypothetical protein
MNKDTWTYIWGSAKYTSSKFYNLSFSAIQAPTPFKWIWDSKVSKKIKIFIWLLFRDRINSRNLLKRKNYKIEGGDYNCVLWSLNVEELSYHLIFQCPFSSNCWSYLGIFWDHHLCFFDTLKKAKKGLPSSLLHGNLLHCCLGNLETEKWKNLQGAGSLLLIGKTASTHVLKTKCIDLV